LTGAFHSIQLGETDGPSATHCVIEECWMRRPYCTIGIGAAIRANMYCHTPFSMSLRWGIGKGRSETPGSSRGFGWNNSTRKIILPTITAELCLGTSPARGQLTPVARMRTTSPAKQKTCGDAQHAPARGQQPAGGSVGSNSLSLAGWAKKNKVESQAQFSVFFSFDE